MSFRKLKTQSAMRRTARLLRRQGKSIVFTNGCFDMLHVGHVRYLNQARKLGDVLVIGLNSDRSVKRLKGSGRPVFSEKERAAVLEALTCVDYITIFDAATPLETIKRLKPHVLAKGGDWAIQDIVGAREVKSWGGSVRRLPYVKGRSTTRTIRRVLSGL